MLRKYIVRRPAPQEMLSSSSSRNLTPSQNMDLHKQIVINGFFSQGNNTFGLSLLVEFWIRRYFSFQYFGDAVPLPCTCIFPLIYIHTHLYMPLFTTIQVGVSLVTFFCFMADGISVLIAKIVSF